MGGGQSSTVKHWSEQRLKFLGRMELYHFGQVDLLEDRLSGKEVIMVPYQFHVGSGNEQQFMSELKVANNDSPFLVQMLRIQHQGSSICGTNSSLFKVYFQHHPTTLSKILSSRTEPLNQEEVKLLVGCLLEALRAINQRETYHGDVYPEFIYLDEKARRYKVFDSAYFNPLKHGYYRALEQPSFSSPQIIANVSERRAFPLYNHFVADTFSLGLVALYSMTLINPIAAYKQKHKEIDYYYIQNLLRIARNRGYSESLLKLVALCVQLKNRPTPVELLEIHPELKLLKSNKLSLRK